MSGVPSQPNMKHPKGECLVPSRKQTQINRTRTWIEDALIWFSEKGMYDDVTVRQLCEKAGVGRPTFYRHFGSKEDVIRSRIDKIFNEFLETLKGIGFDQVSVEQVNMATLEHWRNHEAFFKLARHSELKNIIFSETDKEMEQLTELVKVYGDMDPYLRAFRYWGMKGTLLEWIKQDMQSTPQDVHAALMKLQNS